MTIWLWIVVAELVLSGLVVAARGLNETVKQYTPADAVGGVIEIALLIGCIARHVAVTT